MSSNFLLTALQLTPCSDTCGLCFRRIIEIEEVGPKPTPPAPKPWLDKPTFGMVSFKPTFGPQPAKLKRRREADDFDISGFKRIQILSKENRVKRHFFHPTPRANPGPYSSGPDIANVNQTLRISESKGRVRPEFVGGSDFTLEDSPNAVSGTPGWHMGDHTNDFEKQDHVHVPNGFGKTQAYALSTKIEAGRKRAAQYNLRPHEADEVPDHTIEENDEVSDHTIEEEDEDSDHTIEEEYEPLSQLNCRKLRKHLSEYMETFSRQRQLVQAESYSPLAPELSSEGRNILTELRAARQQQGVASHTNLSDLIAEAEASDEKTCPICYVFRVWSNASVELCFEFHYILCHWGGGGRLTGIKQEFLRVCSGIEL
jgi:hypothetical protein